MRRAGKRFPMPRFLELVAEHDPVGVVVGLPLTGEGTEERERARPPGAGRRGRPAHRPAGGAVGRADEHRPGAGRDPGAGRLTRGRREDVDALAAAVLLQHFLEREAGRTDDAEEPSR